MKQAHPGAYEVRLKGDPEPFLRRLREAGGAAEPHDGVLLVHLGDSQTPDVLWHIAAELGEELGLSQLPLVSA